MINSVNFNPNIIQRPVKEAETVTQPSFEANNEMSPEVSNAYRAYGQAMVQKPLEQLSLNDCILQLQKQGKVEGKDYHIEGCTMGNLVLYVNNRKGQEEKVLHFDDENIQKCSCWEEYKYADSRKIKVISHRADGKIPWYTAHYYNDQIPQEALTKDKLTYDTTPEQHIQYLKKNNINYKISKYGKENNNRDIRIEEFDENGKKAQETWYYYGRNKFVSRSIYDDNEAETKSISFEKDKTEVCTYLEKHNEKTYPVSDFPQESFTKEGLTGKTEPEDYLKYLNDNHIKYTIKTKNITAEDENRKIVTITEFDKNDKEIQSTSFDYDLKFPHKSILRSTTDENGNEQRIELTEENTYVTNFYYD